LRDEPTDGAPTGVAYVVSSGDAVAALSLVPAAGARVTLRAAGFVAGQSVQLPLAGGFELRVSGTTDAGELEVAFSVDQVPAVTQLGAADRIEIALSRGDQGRLLGTEGGPSVRLGAVSAGGWVAGPPASPLDRGGHLQLSGGEVTLAPGFVKSLLGADLAFPLDLDIGVAPGAGVAVAGSPSLRARVAGPDTGRWLDLAVELNDAPGASALAVSFATSLEVSLPGTPVSTHIEGVGLRMPIGLRLGAPLLPDVTAVTALEPQGAGVTVDLPVVSGSGMLARIGEDLAGALAVEIRRCRRARSVCSPPPATASRSRFS
jgi:hypothetical protein